MFSPFLAIMSSQNLTKNLTAYKSKRYQWQFRSPDYLYIIFI
ncbi:hypothetical protein HMPREF1548_03539 [Clostridium sp. KLE 1755]|nr:hypothetical protein HMPREF1548_03539 [Clostridium sp. KLE 1755]